MRPPATGRRGPPNCQQHIQISLYAPPRVIDEAELRKVIREERPPTKLYYFGKFLEALGFLTVAVGLMAGMQGDMYTDLYFFIGGIAVFGAGRMIEKREMRRD